MRSLIFSCYFFSLSLWAFAQPELYYQHITEPGSRAELTELKRDKHISLLKVQVLDKEGFGAFAVVDAAIAIAQARGASHFILLDSEITDDAEVMKIFFTSDVSIDPTQRFAGQMSEHAIQTFKDKGYNSVQDILQVYKLMESVAQ